MYVILSECEISHNQSEKYIPRQFFGGILHFVQNDVFFFYVILSECEISHNQSEKYIPCQLFGGIFAAPF